MEKDYFVGVYDYDRCSACLREGWRRCCTLRVKTMQ